MTSKFIGREPLIEQFNLMLDGNTNHRMLWFVGGGGMGKTQLLRELQQVALNRGGIFVPMRSINGKLEPNLIDVFMTEQRQIGGIRNALIQMLGRDHFDAYFQPRKDTPRVFRACLRELCKQQPILLTFDTLENIEAHFTLPCLLGDEAEEALQMENLYCIVASRLYNEHLEPFRPMAARYPHIKMIDMPRFKPEDTVQLWRKYDPTTNNSATSPEVVTLTESAKGNPLRIELVLAMNMRVDMAADDSCRLINAFYDDGTQELVTIINLEENSYRLRLKNETINTLMWMAVFHRRFNENFLQFLINQHAIKPKTLTPDGIVSQLLGCFFVKRYANGDLQLHDEFFDLIETCLWERFDSVYGIDRSKALKLIERLYEREIKRHKGELTDVTNNLSPEAEKNLRRLIDELESERLAYKLKYDPQEGKRHFYELVNFWSDLDLHRLVEEVLPYLSNPDKFGQMLFSPEERFDVYLQLVSVERALNHMDQAEHYALIALDLAENLRSPERRIKALIDLHNITFKKHRKTPIEDYLADFLLPAKRIAEELLAVGQHPELLAQIQYEIGFTYRRKQDIEGAIREYNVAYDYAERLGATPDVRASIMNDLGFAYGLVGEYELGESLVAEAADIRADICAMLIAEGKHKTWDWHRASLRLGMSQNTKGELQRFQGHFHTAVDLYKNALDIFQTQRSAEWQARTLIARAEAHRLRAREAHKSGRTLPPETYWNRAMVDIDEAVRLLEKFQLTEDHDTACRRRGRLLHDRAVIEFETGKIDRKTALDGLEAAHLSFEEALDWAARTEDVWEELHNRNEIAMLVDDIIDIRGFELANDKVHIDQFETCIQHYAAQFETDSVPPVFLFDVFSNLLEIAKAQYTFAIKNYPLARDHFENGLKSLAQRAGYSSSRFKGLIPIFLNTLQALAREDVKLAQEWGDYFIDLWEDTLVQEVQTITSGRRSSRKLSELHPYFVNALEKLLADLEIASEAGDQ